MNAAKREVAVVGAGAAGLSAAIAAAEAGARVVLFNAHPRIGLKILMSGGTRCNVTHRAVDARDYRGGSQRVVARMLRAFTPECTRAWFAELGVELKLEDTGKYFPVSDTAVTVLDALLRECARLGVDVRPGTRITRLAPPGADGERWRLGHQHIDSSLAFPGHPGAPGRMDWPLPDAAPDGWHDADAVVLATGGLSFPRTGSDGTGYALALALGHSLTPPIPALTPLTATDPLGAALKGLTLPVELTLWRGGKRVERCTGSFLFTHVGYSGPAALDISRHWLRAEDDPTRRLTLNVLPGETRESLEAAWRAAQQEDARKTVRRFLAARLPERLVGVLCTAGAVDPSAPLGQIDKARRAALVAACTEREMPVTGTLGFEKAEVTAGGVPLDEVDASTLASRRAARGLYLCGEILDVDGRLGGFNFQWAWSSGHVAGDAAARTG